jgi:hypothetical protein
MQCTYLAFPNACGYAVRIHTFPSVIAMSMGYAKKKDVCLLLVMSIDAVDVVVSR